LPRKVKRSKKIFILLLPLAALASAGVSSFIWYNARQRPPAEIRSEEGKKPNAANPEEFSSDLAGKLAVLLRDYGVGEKDIRTVRPDSSMAGLRNAFRVNIPSSTSLTLIHLKIRDMAEKNGGKIIGGVESADGRSLSLTLGAGARPTDQVILLKIRGKEGRKQALAVVIVDDFGIHDIADVRRLNTIGQTVTISVLPFQPYTVEVVEYATEAGIPFLLHMPMEPHSSKENPGEGAIFVRDSDETIWRKLSLAFDNVKGATGVNNHMGSRASEDVRVMEAVMRYLRENGCFYVDSRTSNQSEALAVSRRIGVKCALMAGYLDVVDERNAIRKRLYELTDAALEGEPVIILGHNRPATVDVLEQELPRLAEKGIRFVGVDEVVK